MREANIGGRPVGDGHPVYVTAELGINHNGDMNTACHMMVRAREAGADAVKLQKRAPYLSVPRAMWDVPKETPWGPMTYLEYKIRMEFSPDQCAGLWAIAQKIGLPLFWSVWDTASYVALKDLLPDVVAWKIPSAKLTDGELLSNLVGSLERRGLDTPIILSTGMSTLAEIDRAVEILRSHSNVILCHSTSSYPAAAGELNLRCIPTLRERYGLPVGYSGHEVGQLATLAAVALGACFVERHFTLDRTAWGTDQAASMERGEFAEMVCGIRLVEESLGDGVKRVYESELPVLAKLRGATV